LTLDWPAPEEIGVITPYNAQRMKISQLFQKHPLLSGMDITIGSVEEFQGRVRVLSFWGVHAPLETECFDMIPDRSGTTSHHSINRPKQGGQPPDGHSGRVGLRG
jgi:hypothetical protein